MTDVVVRPAHEHEWDEVGALTVAAYRAEGYLTGPVNDYAAELADARDRARHTDLLVAVDDRGAVLGTISVVHPGSPYAETCREGELEFRMLAVRPDARGRGIGEALVRAAIGRAREVGAARLVMSTSERMPSALRLYRRLGFARSPERDWRPKPGVDLIAFRLELS
ncbi:GNAT family N-acetyltransferase [Saccharothrix coeruleofusca]|uniref:N-acetyltransferase n=1 Tax=Saccharothrix coeruleofusca TaxID=33919 RepID=A0A918AIK8_9PSEU|nr:GNAT family N-acetyltransferase [Saccharothrix coeruleofusca]GGP46881.1 N-acetyltransferase [Saccharothrix coeruleofusca]